MAQVVDALVVTLGLDPSGFTKGQKEAAASLLKTRDVAKKTGQDIEESGKKAAEFISTLRREVIGLFAAFTAGRSLKDFIADLTASDAALGRLAQNLNTTPGTLSVWSQAVKRLGGSAEGAQNSFQSLSDSIQELRTTGNTGILVWLNKLGAAGGVNFSFAKPVEKQLLDIADALHNVARTDPQLANFFGKRLGLDQGTINFLMQGRRAVEQQLEAQKRLGKATEESVQAASKLQQAWNDLETVATDLGRVLFVNIAPGLTIVVNKVKEWLQTLRDIQKKPLINVEGFKRQLDEMLDVLRRRTDMILSAFKDAFSPALNWIKARLNEIWRAVRGHDLFTGGSYSDVRERLIGQGSSAQGAPLSSAPAIRPPRRSDGSSIRRQGADANKMYNDPNEFYDAIIKAEGTGKHGDPYNTSLGYMKSPKPLTQMTMDEALAWGDKIRAAQGMNSSAKGAFQIVNTTQRAAMRALGIRGNEMFSEENQRRMASWIARHQGLGAWEGFKLHPGQRARAAAALAAGRDRQTQYPPAQQAPGEQRTSAPLPFFAQTLGAPGVAGATNNNTSTTNSTSNTNNVGNVNVYMPSGSNAVEVAQGIGRAIEQNAFTGHANYGPA